MVRGVNKEEQDRPPFDPLGLQRPEEPSQEDVIATASQGVAVVVGEDGGITLVQLGELPFPELDILYGILGRCRDDIILKMIKGAT